MVISELNGIKIVGLSAAVSNDWTSLENLAGEDVKVVKKFIKSTGVKGRYNAGIKQTTSDFCFVAAKNVIEKKNISVDEIGVLVFVTQTSDYDLPATACVLQKRLGLSNDCLAFDVNLGCSGFTCGLNIVSSLLKASNAKYGLLLAGDTSAKELNPYNKSKESHSASWLFGDSGTATVIEKTNNSADNIVMVSKTDGDGFKAIISPYGMWRNPVPPVGKKMGTTMDDIGVFNFATTDVPDLLKNTMLLTNSNPGDYDCLVLHQANLFILKRISKLTGFEMDKTLISLDEFGNTSSSSVPITLVKEYGDKSEDKQLRSLMCGFGVGLSWSTVDCYINQADILPLIHTDEYFEDGYMAE